MRLEPGSGDVFACEHMDKSEWSPSFSCVCVQGGDEAGIWRLRATDEGDVYSVYERGSGLPECYR